MENDDIQGIEVCHEFGVQYSRCGTVIITDKWNIAPITYPFGNGINFQLEVDNIRQIYSNLKNANYEITFDIEENWYRQDNKLLGNKEFLVQDPDGYLLRFSEDLGEREV